MYQGVYNKGCFSQSMAGPSSQGVLDWTMHKLPKGLGHAITCNVTEMRIWNTQV